MDSESTHPVDRMRPDVQKLHIALQNRNLKAVKEQLADCETLELFDAYPTCFYGPIMSHTIWQWYDCSEACSSSFVSDNEGEILKELVKAGADINEADYDHWDSPLTHAIRFKNLSLCRLLVKLKADLQCANQAKYAQHKSPLYLAAEAGPDFVTFLLEHNVQPTERDDSLWTVSRASRRRIHPNPDVLELFMDLYAKWNRQFPWEKAIEQAFMTGRELHVVAIVQREYHLSHEDHPKFQKNYFESAFREEFIKVMDILIIQQPHILHQSWMVEWYQYSPRHTRRQNRYLEILRSHQSDPFALKLICRFRVLRQLRYRLSLVNQLPLPTALKDYLKRLTVL